MPTRAARATALAAIVLLVAACGGGSDEAPTTATTAPTSAGTAPATPATVPIDGVRRLDDGDLTVCIAVADPPFAMDDDGTVVGLEPDVLAAVGERLGVTTTLQPTDRAAIAEAVLAGRCDAAAAALVAGEPVAAELSLTRPYLDAGQAVVVRAAAEETVDGLDDLAGQRLGVQDGTPAAALLDADRPGDSPVERYETVDELLAALEAKELAAAVVAEPTAAYEADAAPDRFAVIEVLPTTDGYAFAVAPASTAVRDVLDAALDALAADDTLAATTGRWVPAGPEPGTADGG